MFKKLVSLLLSCILLLSMIPAFSITANAVTDATGNHYGYIPIYTKEDLNNIRNNPTANYYLANDIIFTDEDYSSTGSFYNSGNGWQPIENFSGILDGNGHSIKGLYMNVKVKSNYSANYAGLFSTLTGTVSNLAVEDVDITIKKPAFRLSYCGAIAATCSNANIINCRISGRINAEYYCGGIAGSASNTIIVDCYNSCTISSVNSSSSDETVGGIVATAGNSRILKCCNDGTITSGGYDAGGIAGYLTGSTEIFECYNTGKVSSSLYAGGIVGNMSCSSDVNNSLGLDKYCHIVNCYNSGKVTATGTYGKAAGIASSSKTCYITNCYNVGSLSTNDERAGILNGTAGYVKNCYYLDNISSSVDSSTSLKCSLEQMKTAVTFSGFDFKNTWNISADTNNGFPYLRNNPQAIKGTYIKFYSNIPSMVVGINGVISAVVQLQKDGVTVSDNIDYSFYTSNNQVIEITDIEQDSSGTFLKIKGINEGITQLIVTEKNTNTTYTTTIQVTKGILIYNADALPSYYDREHEYNGYVGGMYIDEFTTTEISQTELSVSFNVYNTTSVVGVVDIYDQNGSLISSEPIARFKDNNVTGILDAFWTGIKMIEDCFVGDLFTYKQDSLSEKTEISITVPKGGRIEITNDPLYSNSCAILNFSELAITTLLTYGEFKTSSGKITEIAEASSTTILKQELLRGSFEYVDEFREELTKQSAEKLSADAITTALNYFTDFSLETFKYSETDIMDIVIESAYETGVSISEEAFMNATSVFGAALKGMFTASKWFNLATFYVQLANLSDGNRSFQIYFNNEYGQLHSNGVSIELSNEDIAIQENTVMKVVTVPRNNKENIKINQTINKISDNYILQDIYLEHDGNKINAEGTANATMIIPNDFSADDCKIYRVDNDGTLFYVESKISDGNIIFSIEDFDRYVLIDESAEHTHIYDSYTLTTPPTLSTDGKSYETCSKCGKTNNLVNFPYLKIHNLSASFQGNLSAICTIDKSLIDKYGYENPYIVFNIGESQFTVKKYITSEDYYSFNIDDISITGNVNKSISATLYAEFNETEYSSEQTTFNFTDGDFKNYEFSINNGEVTITSYIGNQVQVIIPETLAGYPVTTIDSKAFYTNRTIKSVTIPSSVKTIGANAFRGCTALTDVIFNEGLESIGTYAFGGTKLVNVVCPSTLKTIGVSAFNGVTTLESIDLANVQEIKGTAFANCTKLGSTSAANRIIIPKTVTSLGAGAFNNCTSIVRVDWYPAKLTSGAAGNITTPAFMGCSGIKTVNIFETVENIPSYLFYKAAKPSAKQGITSLTFKGTPKVKSIGDYAFYQARMGTVTLPDSLEKIGKESFRNCNLLKTISFGNGVNTIGQQAFSNCNNLTSVTIPGNVKTVYAYAFRNCSKLETAVFEEGVEYISSYVFMGTSLKSLTLANSITKINAGITYQCEDTIIYYYEDSYAEKYLKSAYAKLSTTQNSINLGKKLAD